MPKVMGTAGAGRTQRGNRRPSTTLSEINVIPLVDVMLVLLIIFMVAAPMLQRGVEVNLPVSAKSQQLSEKEMYLDLPLSFRKDKKVFLDKEAVRLDVLAERLRQKTSGQTDPQVFIRSDGDLRVQDLITVFDELKAANVNTAGIVTDVPRR